MQVEAVSPLPNPPNVGKALFVNAYVLELKLILLLSCIYTE